VKLRREPDAIPLADARGLLPLARRTAAVRAGAAAGLVALVVAAILVGREPHTRESTLLPARSDGIIVLDLSASISSDTYSRIGAALGDLAASRGRYGLVVFSDTAYEAFPSGTRSDALLPLVRFFRVRPQQTPGLLPTFPVNPWTHAFSAGTRISTGLDLARSMIIDDRIEKPAVLLVSDLDDDPSDLPKVTSLALAYRREGISLDVVALNPSVEDERLFRRLIGGSGSFTRARLPAEREAKNAAHTPFPVWLAALAVAVALGLAAHELWAARLTWGRRPGAEGETV
jgi:hypothetical protein